MVNLSIIAQQKTAQDLTCTKRRSRIPHSERSLIPPLKKIQSSCNSVLSLGQDVFRKDPTSVDFLLGRGKASAKAIVNALCSQNFSSPGSIAALIKIGSMLAERDPLAFNVFANHLTDTKTKAPIGAIVEIVSRSKQKKALELLLAKIKEEGLAMRQKARELLMELLFDGFPPPKSELDAYVSNAKAAISYIINLKDKKTQNLALLHFRFLIKKQLSDRELLDRLVEISTLEAKGTIYLKHFFYGASQINSIRHALDAIPLLSHESREIREGAAVFLENFLNRLVNKNKPITQHKQRILNEFLCRLLRELQPPDSCYKTITQVIINSPFKDSFQTVFNTRKDILNTKNFNPAALRYLVGVLFTYLPETRNRFLDYLVSSPNKTTLSTLIDIFYHGLKLMKPGTLSLTEYSKIVENIHKYLEDPNLPADIRSRMHKTLEYAFRAYKNGNLPSSSSASSKIILISDDVYFREKISKYISEVINSKNLTNVVSLVISNGVNVGELLDELDHATCCILHTKNATNAPNNDLRLRVIRLLQQKNFLPSIFIISEPGEKIAKRIEQFDIRSGAEFGLNVNVYDKSYFLIKENLISLLDKIGTFQTRIQSQIYDLNAYLNHPFIEQKIAQTFEDSGFKEVQIQGALLLYPKQPIISENTTTSKITKSLLLIGPAAQVSDIKIEGVMSLTITNFGNFSLDLDMLPKRRHNLRISYWKDNESFHRLAPISGSDEGETVHLDFYGKPYNLCISNRISEGVTVLKIEEIYIPKQ